MWVELADTMKEKEREGTETGEMKIGSEREKDRTRET